MNVFNRIMDRQTSAERTLGNPLRGPAAIERRLNIMANMTGGKGFRKPRLNEKRGLSKGEKRRRERQEGRANG